jgi:hypothetical protein
MDTDEHGLLNAENKKGKQKGGAGFYALTGLAK